MHEVQKSNRTDVDNFNQSYVVKYRFINVKSLDTDESINIGIVIEKNDGNSPIIHLVNNLDFFHKLFPIFDLEHAHVCLNIIKTKYKLKKVQQIRMDISNSISLSNVKIHQEMSGIDPMYIENILYEKYFTLSKTERAIKHFYKLRQYKEYFFKKINTESSHIEDAVITMPLISSNSTNITSISKKLKYRQYRDFSEIVKAHIECIH